MIRSWEDDESLQFVECKTCKVKPGMPVLCDPCVHNRHAIFELHKTCDKLADIGDKFSLAFADSERRFILNRRIWFLCSILGAISAFGFGYLFGRCCG